MSVIKLSKPLLVGEEIIDEITLRQPTVKEVAEIGYPFIVVSTDNGSGVDLRPKVVLRYVSKLAAIPPSSLDELSLGDLSALQAEVMGFFGQEAATPTA